MGKKILYKLLAAALVLVFITYIGYQMYANLSDPITTVDGMLVTVEDRFAVEGVFFRSQFLVTGGKDQSVEYLVSDGEKVSKGQDLAVYFGSGSAAGTYQQIQSLEADIASLQYALRTLSGGTDSAKVDSLIYVEMQDIMHALEQGSADRVAGSYAYLGQLVASRGAPQNDRSSYQDQIDALNVEKARLEAALQGSVSRVSTPESGYFFKNTDGFETVLTLEAVAQMTPSQLENVAAEQVGTDVVGTVVSSYEWYFAAVVSKQEGAAIRERRNVGVSFAQIGVRNESMEVHSVTTYEDGRAIVIFRSGVMDERYLSARYQSADITLTTYTGIKVPREALRQVDGEWGVYCLEGAVAKFKPVQWIYQTDSYVLVENAASAKEGLYMYDKIIVGAKGLEDKKVVK